MVLIDHKLLRRTVPDENEAHYLAAMVNSEAMQASWPGSSNEVRRGTTPPSTAYRSTPVARVFGRPGRPVQWRSMPRREHEGGGRATLEASEPRTATERQPSAGSEPAEPGAAWRPSFLLWAVIACVLVAGLSVAFLLPSSPSYDPWAWIVWGREIDHGVLHTGLGPSWKPGPVLVTAIFGFAGGLVSNLWLLVARAAGLLALFAAYRLGERLAGRWAGAVAAAALLLTEGWLGLLARGASEPALVGLVLASVLCHVDGRRRAAFGLGVAAGLIRPEVWPFLGLYALWLWFREPKRFRWALVGGLALIPLLWLGPPWIGSGDPLNASTHAARYNGNLGNDPALEALRRGVGLAVLPVLLLGLAAVARAVRVRDRVTLGIAGGALAWLALVVVMSAAAYPGLPRFMLPAAALWCVLAGAGAVHLVRLGRGPVAVALALALVAIAVPFSVDRAERFGGQARSARQAHDIFGQLTLAVSRAGGRRKVLRCSPRRVGVNHALQTALAWKLDAPLRQVRPVMRGSGWAFSARRHVGAGPRFTFVPTKVVPLASAGPWRVEVVSAPNGRPSRPGCPA